MKNHVINGLVLVAALVIAGLIGVSIFHVIYRPRYIASTMIAHEVKQLQNIFKKINQDCGIISFDSQKNNINFLNVKDFVGSEVGPMNLARPQGWQGPYVKDNPTIQGKEYQVVNTNNGYYIAPGDGVVLANGKEIGKDILLDKQSDIDFITRKDGPLMHQGAALAVKLSFD
jgi:hypothetical protein